MATTYDYPSDLIAAQQALTQVRADLTALYKRLPYSVEPMEGWQRPEGYWLTASRAYPDSPGWSEQEQREVAVLRERERDLTAAIIKHAFWNDVAGPERLDARSQLKHALAREDGEGQEAA
ncbi:nucleic acid-binding protein [Streptomyces sp. NPDC127105]|uniref:nucleic acid-binding protein n=1 Tax=Streptomyces sp. NPDC127105 TaxID=3345359 RepID=UPI00364A828F